MERKSETLEENDFLKDSNKKHIAFGNGEFLESRSPWDRIDMDLLQLYNNTNKSDNPLSNYLSNTTLLKSNTLSHNVEKENRKQDLMKSDFLLNESDLLLNTKNAEMLSNKSELLSSKSDMLSNKSDLLSSKSDLLSNKSDQLNTSDLLINQDLKMFQKAEKYMIDFQLLLLLIFEHICAILPALKTQENGLFHAFHIRRIAHGSFQSVFGEYSNILLPILENSDIVQYNTDAFNVSSHLVSQVLNFLIISGSPSSDQIGEIVRKCPAVIFLQCISALQNIFNIYKLSNNAALNEYASELYNAKALDTTDATNYTKGNTDLYKEMYTNKNEDNFQDYSNNTLNEYNTDLLNEYNREYLGDAYGDAEYNKDENIPTLLEKRHILDKKCVFSPLNNNNNNNNKEMPQNMFINQEMLEQVAEMAKAAGIEPALLACIFKDISKEEDISNLDIGDLYKEMNYYKDKAHKDIYKEGNIYKDMNMYKDIYHKEGSLNNINSSFISDKMNFNEIPVGPFISASVNKRRHPSIQTDILNTCCPERLAQRGSKLLGKVLQKLNKQTKRKAKSADMECVKKFKTPEDHHIVESEIDQNVCKNEIVETGEVRVENEEPSETVAINPDLSSISSTMRGVFFNRSLSRWVCTWSRNGKEYQRSWSAGKYGYETARGLAMQCRLEKLLSGEARTLQKGMLAVFKPPTNSTITPEYIEGSDGMKCKTKRSSKAKDTPKQEDIEIKKTVENQDIIQNILAIDNKQSSDE